MLSPIPALLPPQYHHLPNEAISSSARLERRRSTWCHLHPGKPPYSRQGLVAGPLSKQGDLVGVCSPTATKGMLCWFKWKEFSPQEPVLSSSVTSTCWLFLFHIWPVLRLPASLFQGWQSVPFFTFVCSQAAHEKHFICKHVLSTSPQAPVLSDTPTAPLFTSTFDVSRVTGAGTSIPQGSRGLAASGRQARLCEG